MQDDQNIDQMSDDQFDSLLRDAARSYNEPPAPNVDRMWAAIEQEHFNTVAPRTQWYANSWIRVAAALILGVGIGRVTLATKATSNPSAQVAVQQPPSVDRSSASGDALPALNAPEANKYLGETVALLASLQSDSRASRNDTQLVSDAAQLLSTTRFLLDAPTNDPSVRGLLEDLELVLAQVVQLPNKRSAHDVEIIHQAMEQRDVMPRLRTAVAQNFSADE